MGAEAGEALIAKVQGQTFGQTISQLRAAKLLSAALEARFLNLLRERNWLVHSSRADCRGAVYSDAELKSLWHRLERMAEEALALLREIGALAEKHVIAHGISQQEIDQGAANLLTKWRKSDAI